MASNFSPVRTKPEVATKGRLDIPLAGIGVFVASALGGWITTLSIETGWYALLTKSSLNPSSVVFGPVWTLLYVMLFIAFIYAWKGSADSSRDYKVIFGANLFLNLMWSVAFFGFKSAFGGFLVILLYLAVCIANALIFKKYSSVAAWLVLPLIAWVSFASYLNFVILRFN
jgi:translocator protein